MKIICRTSKLCADSIMAVMREGPTMNIWDEEVPRKRATYELGTDLSTWSVAELEEYIAALAAERERVEATITAKKASQNAAQSVFKM